MVSQNGRMLIREFAEYANGNTKLHDGIVGGRDRKGVYKEVEDLASLLVDTKLENDNTMAVGMTLLPMISGITGADVQGAYVHLMYEGKIEYTTNLNHRGSATFHNVQPKYYDVYLSLD